MRLIGLLAIVALSGCLQESNDRRPSALGARLRPKPISPGPNGLTIDLAHLERPFGDLELNNDLWESADEEALDIAARRRLAAHGLRVAILGKQFPPALKAMLEHQECGPLSTERLQIQSGSPTQIQTSGFYATWPRSEDVGDGETDFNNAVATLRVVPTIQSDGCIQLSITPQIDYGTPRRMFVPSDMSRGPLDWSIEVGRQTRTFDDLNFLVKLRADQHLIIGCQSSDRSSLGACFFSDQRKDQVVQRALLIQSAPSREAIAARIR